MQQPNASLDDVLKGTPSSSFVQKSDGDAGAMSQIEALLGGESAEQIEETPEEVEEETVSEEEEETPTDAEEAESDETEDEESEETAEEETEETETLELTEDQLSGILGLPEDGAKVDDEGNLLIRTKVNGEVDFVPLSDLTTSYQLEKHLRQKSQVDADNRREFEAYKAEETTKLQQSVTDATALVLEMEQALKGEMQKVNWDHLRQANPAEWAAKQQEFKTKDETINQAKTKLAQTIQAQQEQQHQQSQEALQKKILEETDRLIEKVPRWSDQETASKELTEIQNAIGETYGFTPDEIAAVADHRLVLMMMDAVKGKAVSDPEPAKKKLKVVPKIVKKGSRVNKKSIQQKQKATAKQTNLKKTGSTQAAADLIFDML